MRYQNNSGLQCAAARANFDKCRSVADTTVPHRENSPYCDAGCRSYFALGTDVNLLYEVNLLDFVVEFMSLILLMLSSYALVMAARDEEGNKGKIFFKVCASLMFLLLIVDLALQAIALETAQRAEPLAAEMKECVNTARNVENRDTLVALTEGMSIIINLGLGELVIGVCSLVAASLKIFGLGCGTVCGIEDMERNAFIVEFATSFINCILTAVEFFILTRIAKEDSDALRLSIRARDDWCITLSDECTDMVREAAGPAFPQQLRRSFVRISFFDRTLGITLLVYSSLVWLCLSSCFFYARHYANPADDSTTARPAPTGLAMDNLAPARRLPRPSEEQSEAAGGAAVAAAAIPAVAATTGPGMPSVPSLEA